MIRSRGSYWRRNLNAKVAKCVGFGELLTKLLQKLVILRGRLEMTVVIFSYSVMQMETVQRRDSGECNVSQRGIQ